MTHRYRIRQWGSPRFRQPCEVLAGGRNGNILVRFQDGFLMLTTRYGVRRLES